jgi:hypothetical protein
MQYFSNLAGFIGSSFLSVLFICVGMPLFTGKVMRNYFYGYYLSKAGLEHDEIWFPVNKMGGFHLILLGGFYAVSALVALYFIKNFAAQIIIIKINVLICVLAATYTVIRTGIYSKQLSRSLKKTKKKSK